MARPTLAAHPKFAKLVARLRGTPLPRSSARGVLELIWEAGYASGDPFIGDAEAVEAIADWSGPAGQLAGHLVASGFLDRDEAGGHYIHDLADHAPDYVSRRMAREEERRRNGTTISEIRAQAASKRKTSTANDSKRNSFAANVDPPAPAPAPESSPPAPARDPSASRTVAMTGPYLTHLFGRIRSEETGGGFEWQGTPTSPEKAATQAEIVSESGNAAHVEASMRLLFSKAKRGEIDEAAKILRSPAFAFGCWCSDFVPLVEEVTGTAPEMPIAAARSARAGPRQAPHEITRAAALRFLEREAAKDTAT